MNEFDVFTNTTDNDSKSSCKNCHGDKHRNESVIDSYDNHKRKTVMMMLTSTKMLIRIITTRIRKVMIVIITIVMIRITMMVQQQYWQ